MRPILEESSLARRRLTGELGKQFRRARDLFEAKLQQEFHLALDIL